MRSSRAALAALSGVLLLAALPFGAQAQDPPELRTDAGDVGGYVASARGAPVSLLIFEPVIPIPVDPGEPHMEVTTAWASAFLSTGPQARAVASSLWPGPALGDGFRSVCACDADWPMRVEARYPTGEPTAAQELPSGSGMSAAAQGLDVFARSRAAESPVPEVVTFGDVSSNAHATVVDGLTIAELDVSIQDISIGGVIRIQSVSTSLRASSDMGSAVTQGQTAVQGLTIAGNGYVVDEEGLRPVQDGGRQGALLPVPPELRNADQLREQLGIALHIGPHDEDVLEADAARTAAGLRISIDTAVLKAHLGPLLDPLVGTLPEEMQAEFASLLALGPRLDLVLGRGEVRAAATTPFELPDFDPPLLPDMAPPPAAVPFDAPPPEPFVSAPPPPFQVGPPVAVSPPAPDTGDEPEVAPDGAVPAAAVGTPEMFAGIPVALIALSLVAVALGARGLTVLGALAVGGAAVCDQGAVKRLPDLRARSR